MKIENQVCTLEQRVKLFNYGITESIIHHYSKPDGTYIECDKLQYPPKQWVKIPAFTSTELGEMLPNCFTTMKLTGEHDMPNHRWRIYNEDDADAVGDVMFETEAQARAAALIHLLENNHITSEQVNASISQ